MRLFVRGTFLAWVAWGLARVRALAMAPYPWAISGQLYIFEYRDLLVIRWPSLSFLIQ
jgi:hypothetical protein